jgi:hypothetical protein
VNEEIGKGTISKIIGILLQYDNKAIPKNLKRECDKALWVLEQPLNKGNLQFGGYKFPITISFPKDICKCKKVINCVEELVTCKCKHGHYFVEIKEVGEKWLT